MRQKRWQPTLRNKLMISFTGIVLVVLSLALFSGMELRLMRAKVDEQNKKAALEHKALELEVVIQDLKDLSSGLMISRSLTNTDAYTEKRKTFNDLIRAVGETASTDEQFQWRSQLVMASTDFLDVFDRSVKLIKDPSLKADDIQRNTESLYNEAQTQRDILFDIVNRFDLDYKKDADAAAASTSSMIKQINTIMTVVGGCVLLVTLLIAVLLIRSFMTPVRRLQNAVAVISSGDLRHRIDNQSTDELGSLSRDFDTMTDKVRTLLSGSHHIASALSGLAESFRGFSKETAEGNRHVLQAIGEIAAGSDQQAAQAEKSTQVLHELERDMDGIYRFTESLLEAGNQAAGQTKDGVNAVQALQQSSHQSQEMGLQVVQAMKELQEGSTQIGKVVTAIADIASQTNVLALNAAIEAARAGSAGIGFAVVADQIRTLSAQSGTASKQVGQQIAGIQKQIAELSERMQRAGEGSRVQNARIEETLQAFSRIRAAMEAMSGMIVSTRDKIGAVHMRSTHLMDAVQLVASIAEETAASIQEVSSSAAVQDDAIAHIAVQAEEIYDLSRQLFGQIGYFRIVDEEDRDTGPDRGAVDRIDSRPSLEGESILY